MHTPLSHRDTHAEKTLLFLAEYAWLELSVTLSLPGGQLDSAGLGCSRVAHRERAMPSTKLHKLHKLHDLLRACDWSSALEHLATHQHEAATQDDSTRMLPIHVALLHDAPPEVPLALLAAGDALLTAEQRVTVVGLTNDVVHPDSERLNNKAGVVAKYLPQTQRYMVVMEKPTGAGRAERVRLKRENLNGARRVTCKVKDRWGRMPLHWALAKRADAAVTLAVLAAHCGACREDDEWSSKPLHLALANDAAPEVTLAVLREHTYAASIKDGHQRLPLEYAIERRQASEEVLYALRTAIPASDASQSSPARVGRSACRGRTRERRSHRAKRRLSKQRLAPLSSSSTASSPESSSSKEAQSSDRGAALSVSLQKLQRAVRRTAAVNRLCKPNGSRLHGLLAHKRWHAALDHVAKRPAQAQAKDEVGRLALHIALEYGATARVVQALLKADCSACSEADSHKRLPLHIALLHKASATSTLAVLAAHKGACKAEDKDGQLPLHHALSSRADGSVLRALLDEYPGACRVRSSRSSSSMLPLHLAFAHKVDAEIQRAILEAHPDACKEKDGGQMLALHWALWGEADTAVVMAVLEADPSACQHADGNGRMPLHWSLVQPATDEAITLRILDEYGDACAHAEGTGATAINRDMMPLHWAVLNAASLRVVTELLEVSSYATKVTDPWLQWILKKEPSIKFRKGKGKDLQQMETQTETQTHYWDELQRHVVGPERPVKTEKSNVFSEPSDPGLLAAG